MPVFLNFIEKNSSYSVKQKSKFKWQIIEYGHKIVIDVKLGAHDRLKSVKLHSIEDDFTPNELKELASIMTVLSVEGGALK